MALLCHCSTHQFNSHVPIFTDYQSSQRKQAYTSDDRHTLHYVLVIDRSGSMAIRMQEVLGAVNRQIETLTQESKASGSRCLLSVVRFDDEIEILHLEKPVEEVRPITADMLAPRGLTALVDATTLSIERAAELFGNRIDGEKESLAMVIYTDGGENASRLRTITDLKTALKITRISLVGTSPLWVHRWKHLP